MLSPNEMTKSSVGRKALAGVTGLILVLFVIGHMLGNLQIFLGQDAINSYAVHLRELGPLLWIVRGVLLASLLIHIFVTISLARENRAARPQQYACRSTVQATLSSRIMVASGLLLFAYIVYHLLHFTFHTVHGQYAHHLDARGRSDVYTMMVLSFKNVYISAFYIIAMVPLCSHLSHGVTSWIQSLGLVCEGKYGLLRKIGNVTGFLIFLGYVLIPVSVLAGIVRLP